jgi:cytochrome c oxidase cbb3-type subunit 3
VNANRYMLIGILLLVSNGCQRETREFHPPISTAELPTLTPTTDYRIGGTEDTSLHEALRATDINNVDENNAYTLSEGKRLFSTFNCTGCHARGGGGMGVPLRDDRWIYGSSPQQIFATIVEGRPNGMPSYGGRIPALQVRQLAAYVRSLSGLASSAAATGRNDDIGGTPPENSAPGDPPKQSTTPPPAEGSP